MNCAEFTVSRLYDDNIAAAGAAAAGAEAGAAGAAAAGAGAGSGSLVSSVSNVSQLTGIYH